MKVVAEDIAEIKAEIEKLKTRNRKVEEDKAWETSWVRRIAIAVATYFVVSVLMQSIGVDRPYTNAIIPAIAYLISTTTLSLLRNLWLTHRKKKWIL